MFTEYITNIALYLCVCVHAGTYNKYLPYIILGGFTIGSSLVNLFLPETLNKDLPETLDQMQKCQG